MRFIITLAMALWLSNTIGIAKADEPKAQPAAAREVEALTPEAEKTVKELRASLAKDSEALAMLEDILKGSNLGAEDGWFPLAKAKSRYDWSFVCGRYDSNADNMVTPDEFGGDKSDFQRLDVDNDGKLTDADFDWSKHSLTPTPGFMMFFMADRDANGKVTQEEFSQIFAQLTNGQKRSTGESFLSLDELRDEFTPQPPRGRENRPDRPSRSTLVAGLKNQEIGSLLPGPQLGDRAPDFTLSTLDGEPFTLSKQFGDKPTVLIFGNFTCGPFRSQAGNIERLYDRYCDRANFFLIYVREAHPSDGWWMQSNQRVGIDLAQPKDNEGRQSAAAKCKNHLDLDIPFLVDTVDDSVGATYSGMPNRLYLIDKDGHIAFKNGRGPFGFHPRQLEQALLLLLNERRQTK